jgi:hypothetical protein
VSAAATAKRSTVTRPALRPALPVASGIIESISITSRAPAAKPSIAAWGSLTVGQANYYLQQAGRRGTRIRASLPDDTYVCPDDGREIPNAVDHTPLHGDARATGAGAPARPCPASCPSRTRMGAARKPGFAVSRKPIGYGRGGPRSSSSGPNSAVASSADARSGFGARGRDQPQVPPELDESRRLPRRRTCELTLTGGVARFRVIQRVPRARRRARVARSLAEDERRTRW